MIYSKKDWEDFQKGGLTFPHYYHNDANEITSMVRISGFGGMADNNGSPNHLYLTEYKGGKRYSRRFELVETREMPAEKEYKSLTKDLSSIKTAIEVILCDMFDAPDFETYKKDNKINLIKNFEMDSLDQVNFIMNIAESFDIDIEDKHDEVLLEQDISYLIDKLIFNYPEVIKE